MLLADPIFLEEGSIDSANKSGLEKDIASAVNAALEAAKREAGSRMTKMAGGMGGLGDLLGGM